MNLINSNITTNFTYLEIACNDTSETLILNDDIIRHANRLQTFRNWYNRPMNVTSWYRTTSYNTLIGGSTSSQHLLGLATDVTLPSEFYSFTNERKREFVNNCQTKWHSICDGGGGFGIYDTFMHFDSRATKSDFDYRSNKDY